MKTMYLIYLKMGSGEKEGGKERERERRGKERKVWDRKIPGR